MRKRPEVARAVILFHAGELETRKRVIEVHFDQEELFVVAKTDVVARAIFLDELAFEQERFGLAFDRVRFEVPDAFKQRQRFAVVMMLASGMKILADALIEITRLADVDYAVEAVFEKIDARLVRQVAHFGHHIGTFSEHVLVCHKGQRCAS